MDKDDMREYSIGHKGRLVLELETAFIPSGATVTRSKTEVHQFFYVLAQHVHALKNQAMEFKRVVRYNPLRKGTPYD